MRSIALRHPSSRQQVTITTGRPQLQRVILKSYNSRGLNYRYFLRNMIVALIVVTIISSGKLNAFHIAHSGVSRPFTFIPQQRQDSRTNQKSFAHVHDQNCNHSHGNAHHKSETVTKPLHCTIRRRIQQLASRLQTINPSSASSTRIQTQQLHSDKQNTIVFTSGIGSGLFGTVKKLHNPILYFLLGIAAGFRYDWCFKSPVYWFAIGFTIKWYRARYVFKIPVWDRQPNWNNIITSKEQEKDLKAFTCKKCGSTIFIAKTREFFFEGNTGIGGLGCFSCGARGKENFTMDRDRIVEDVGDMDDYFEYERPLDFISRAERRKLLKEAQGDEDKANLLLLERTTGISSVPPPASIDAVIADANEDTTVQKDISDHADDGEILESHQVLYDETSAQEMNEIKEAATHTSEADPMGNEATSDSFDVQEEISKLRQPPKVTTTPATVQPNTKTTASSVGLDGLDELDMDAW
jgi:hypothetical protein